MSWWWCLEHRCVEEGPGCGSTTRIGPYDSPERAATALQRIRQREEEQQEKDKAVEARWGKKKPRF
jgi:hypothetical protein